MNVKETREIMVDWLNEALELDGDLVCSVMTHEYDISPDSDLAGYPAHYDKKGVKVMTALSLVSAVLGKRIEPVFEGDVIQRFE